MKKIKVTISRLEQHCDGLVTGASVTFRVVQNANVLVEDSLTGKATQPYSKIYDVNADDSDVYVTHNRNDLSWLTITAEFID